MNPKLLNTTIEEVMPRRKMIVVDSELHLADAFSTLVKNNIYSAPVYDTHRKLLLGYIDMLDIVVFLIKIIEDDKHTDKTDFTSKDFYALLDQVTKFRTEHVKAVTDISARNPLIPVNHNAPIKEVLHIFANSGTHRVPVLENPWTVCNIITQSYIISWLANQISLHNENNHEHHHQLGPVGHKKVSEVFEIKQPVVSVKGDQPAIDAFKLMAHHRISSVAVVDKNEALLSNLSAKDIKVIEPDAIFTKLYKSCTEFIAATRAHELNAHYPMIYCKLDSTVEEVVQRLAFMRIHRIYVIDENRKPVNVISLGDILSVLLPK